jgi:hypothetical protein
MKDIDQPAVENPFVQLDRVSEVAGGLERGPDMCLAQSLIEFGANAIPPV